MLNYMNFYYNRLNESVYDSVSGNEDIIMKLDEVDIYDQKTKKPVKVKVEKLIKVVNDGVYKMMRDYPYLYQFMTKCKIMYIPVCPSEITNTMAVDGYNNLWINFDFVYNVCLMDSNRVFGILFHEMFHIFFDHILRFNEMYPVKMFDGMEGARQKANMKANICMDYEVNASMVDDNIVSPDFFKRMNGLYNKAYTGMTWEEIMHKVGDDEYKKWLIYNGFSLDDVELKILDAIEKASKVLMDPSADDDEKRYARKELRKTLDKLLGKKENGEKTLQDELEDLQNSKLGDIADISLNMDDVIDDLHKDPSKMTDDELSKTLNDMDRMMDSMSDNSEEIAKQFNKGNESTSNDIEKARKSLKDAMEKIKKGGLSNDEKEDLLDKAKDDLEDIISDGVEKEKLKKKREERDAKKEEKRKELLKKRHPIRNLIIVMKNLADLRQIGLVSDNTVDILNKNIDILDKLTEKKFSEIKKNDLKDLSHYLDDLKESLLPDLVALIDNETILNKTKEDMERLLDGVFDHIFNAFRKSIDKELDDDAKGSLMKMAASKLRIIGKVLKTQKVWRTTDEFKDAYVSEMKRCTELIKSGNEKKLFKELYDNGVIDIMSLDRNGMKLYKELLDEGEIK